MSAIAIPQSDLAAAIVTEHKAARVAMSTAVSHAIRAGELLIQAKARVGHGGFGAFCQGLPFSDRTARAYMQLAGLDQANRQRVAEMGLREALASIAAPKPEPKPALTVTPWEPPDHLVIATIHEDNVVTVEPSKVHPGYFHVCHLDLERGIITGTERPMLKPWIAKVLMHWLRVDAGTMDWAEGRDDLSMVAFLHGESIT